ncbi:hypothetical protein T03_5177 [Trichinella britovi]|uniref:Uncharacterized protein n=1 Tax=Trichinella britovi TaxID=45882 RepID=A0A0V1C818_TRIBR|nr:hypothetical protein T03_5177 [Trichinella britovi]
MLTLLTSRIRRFLSEATIAIWNLFPPLNNIIFFYVKHAVSNHAALNQVLTHKFFGISQEIRNHGWSGLVYNT